MKHLSKEKIKLNNTANNNREHIYSTGIDIGSTTVKAVISDVNGIVFHRYVRHQAQTFEATRNIFREALRELGDIVLDPAVTGSAGMGIAEAFGLPFVQEVVASAHFIRKQHPDVRTFIEIGGEDSKIIFFDEYFQPDIRMNGACAGGTGAFIDQVAVLLDVDASQLNALAEKSTGTYPIASRCGVFAKTDIQALLSRHVSKADIAASVFHSVALQVITALSRGRDIEPKILLGGGPLSFYPVLRRAFRDVLGVENDSDLVIPEHPLLVPAFGTAMLRNGKSFRIRISKLLSLFDQSQKLDYLNRTQRLPILFQNKAEFVAWKEKHAENSVPRVAPKDVATEKLFLGVDSGSTTTKLTVIDSQGRVVWSFYCSNNGDPVQAVGKGLADCAKSFKASGVTPQILRTAVTGYGESLIKAAYGLDDGIIETLAHYRAARQFEPDVSFILDIGGQDMKAIYVEDGSVSEIQVNEACSSGCGSFLETFARVLGYEIERFAELACRSKSPFDLGTRCTVFMNSRVKQALREGASVPDISAGLAYSVIKNALYKVLKLKNTDILGDNIVVQGGAFRNNAVLRAIELLLEKKVVRPDIPELMGAYGAALTAAANYSMAPERSRLFRPTENMDKEIRFSRKEIQCRGCENQCTVLQLTFENGNRFYTGNRCERYFSNNPEIRRRGKNLIEEQVKLLFDRELEPENEPILTYGIPRCLNMYENFPFWAAFLTTCGFKVVLSAPSSFKLYEKGSATVMSENICFPAKLAHGHIFDLVNRKVDRIFYPTVVYEQPEFENALNTYNCPVVTGYPDLLCSAIDPEQAFGIPLDHPSISFKHPDLLTDQLYLFFRPMGINYSVVSRGVQNGLSAYLNFRKELKSKADALIRESREQGNILCVLAGRPYHQDQLINHGIPNLLTEFGVDVISEKAAYLHADAAVLSDRNVLTQWSYTNRLYSAAEWVAKTRHAQLIQLTSFGCGPDAIAADEVRDIIRAAGKIYTLIKMDEIANLGAVKIRIRSMLGALNENSGRAKSPEAVRKPANPNGMNNNKVLITPYFSPFYSPLIPPTFRPLGFRVDVLPPQDQISAELGLKTVNNEMCYPSILIAGDIIKAFQSGKYDPDNTAVILTQTGGQCRASSYLSLIRKGLADAGMSNVPVIAVSNDEIHPQPDFKINTRELFKRMALGIIFADPLARMYLACVVREKKPGTSKALHEKYLSRMEPGLEEADYQYLLNLLIDAVSDFNAIEMRAKPIPRIGIVGEIFVKYNFFSNGNIIDWLSSQGVEVILPPLQSFFSQRFINETFDQKAFFKRSWVDRIKYRIIEIYSKYHLAQIERVMQGFRFYRKSHDLRKLAEITGEVVSLANQFGEGWLLTAEMIAMLDEGINNIVCLQPFGCIANHITGKGIEKKLREMYPALNLLSLDMDAGVSEVNLMNRLHFMISGSRELMAYAAESPPGQRGVRWNLQHFRPLRLVDLNSYAALELEKWKAWVSGLGLLEKARNIKFRKPR